MNLGHEVALALRMAYWTMHRQADCCLHPLGVTANQFVLLSLLAEGDGITQQELVHRASSDPNTVRAMLVALEDKGLVVRSRHPTDGRAWSVALSSKGRRTFRRLRTESEPFRERLRAAFLPGEAETLLRLLQRVSECMKPSDPEQQKESTTRRAPVP